LPFLFGAQYYRAPTPHREFWKRDLARMAEVGFNMVKFWPQWRWSHPQPGRFFLEDLDELMDLAGGVGISVTLNVIFDVAPSWLYQQHPDCKMVQGNGQIVEPRPVHFRQLGGYPGPCLNHPAAREARRHFLAETTRHFAGHRAMGMWDVWNEPEFCAFLRKPDVDTLLCYCEHCRREFVQWLQRKYGTIQQLNTIWGRCYQQWDELELPRFRQTFADMIDWRLFQAGTLAQEAAWRVKLVKELDQDHPVYLHPVPTPAGLFNSVTGPDDFQLAEGCDCFGGSINGYPYTPMQAVAAAGGRVCYNVESHVRFGGTRHYPRPLQLPDVAGALVPQLGLGIRGFLFWQYRCESLGGEAPAWGMLDPDGSEGSTFKADVEFWRRLAPVASRLMTAPPPPLQAAIFKSAANEIFHFCVHGDIQELRDTVEGFSRLLYRLNAPVGYVDSRIVQRGLPKSLKVLVLPLAYALDAATAKAIAAWVHEGGTLICESLTGSYDLDTGRHGGPIPGLGLAEVLGLRETNPTAAYHVPQAQRGAAEAGDDTHSDLAKAFQAFGVRGADQLVLKTDRGEALLGRHHYAEVAGEQLECIAGLPGQAPVIAQRAVGRGRVLYAGTQVAWQEASVPALAELVDRVLVEAGVQRPAAPRDVHIDTLQTSDGVALAITNMGRQPAILRLEARPEWRDLVGLFTDQLLAGAQLCPDQADLFVPRRWRTKF
jgi:beta-galactosidase